MKEIKINYPEYYNTNLKLLMSKTQLYSLSKISEKAYLKWQGFFREQYPEKPLIFDIAWALNR